MNSVPRKISMIRNHFKTAFRMMVKNKLHTVIHLIGLTIGLFAFMLALTVITDEWSYDKFWTNASRIYKAHWTTSANKVENTLPLTTLGLANSMVAEFPEVEAYTRAHPQDISFRLEAGQDDEIKVNILKVDTTFSSIFELETVSGSLNSFTPGYRNIVISESFRERYFRNRNPVGTIISDVPQWSKEPNEYLITGVFKDMPQNTHLKTDVLMIARPDIVTTDQTGAMEVIYFLFKPHVKKRNFEEKLAIWNGENYSFQPLTDIYLNSDGDPYLHNKSSKTNLILFALVAILLLGIACINFINLHTVQMLKRLKESGVRKVMGASVRRLTQQYLLESSMYFLIAGLLAFSVYIVVLPLVETFLGHPLQMTLLNNFSLFANGIGIIALFCGLITLYPAWKIARVKPVVSLKKNANSTNFWGGETLRNSLLVVQFSLSVIVLIAAFVVQNQMELVNKKEIGFNPNQLLHIAPIRWGNDYNPFKDRLREITGVSSVSASSWNAWTMSMGRNSLRHPLFPEENFTYDLIIAEQGIVETLELNLITGSVDNESVVDSSFTDSNLANRDVSDSGLPDKSQQDPDIRIVDVLLTAHTAALLQYDELGKNIATMLPTEMLRPVGIIKDLHTESLHKSLQATIIWLVREYDAAGLYIRTEEGREKQVAASITALWNEFFPNHLLQMDLVSDKMEQLYAAEHKQQSLVTILAGLTLTLACLGIFGLITHYTQVRIKEIGIRKVLGASVSGIVWMLSKDFVKFVCLAIVIASPLAWWAMNNWLEDFAYRIELQWWMFALSGVVAVGVALLTVSWQAVRAAIANPVEALRDE